MTLAAPLYDLRGVSKVRVSGSSRFHLDVPELVIQHREIVIVRGPSGCGKSTLLDLLAMTLRPDFADSFEFRSTPIADLAPVHAMWLRDSQDRLAALRGAHIGYVVQTGGLLPYFSVRANIELPGRLNGRLDPGNVCAIAERLGIDHVLSRLPASLSVGERQRVAIARALSHRPSVVIADEPTAALDPINAETTFRLFLELVVDTGATAVIATHDPERGTGPGVALVEHSLERLGDEAHAVFRRGRTA